MLQNNKALKHLHHLALKFQSLSMLQNNKALKRVTTFR